MINDEKFLLKAIALAKKGQGLVNPGPMVGALIVNHNKIIGSGYYAKDGAVHAEVMALNSAKKKAVGSTMYLSLEPHCYHSRTLPCTDAIIKAKIKRVAVASLDTNPKVNGKSLDILRRAGIKVNFIKSVNPQAKKLNDVYFTSFAKKRPFVAIKFAASLDGKLATYLGDSKWITNDELRNYTRVLRGHYQAILVGINTVLNDNPHLGARHKNQRDPIRIILDNKLQIPLNSKVLRDSNVIIATNTADNKNKKSILKKRQIKILKFKGKNIPIKKLLTELIKINIRSILVEGGGATIGSFIDEKLVDKVYACYAPILVGGSGAVSIGGQGVKLISQSIKLKNIICKKFGDNFLIEGYVVDYR